MNDWLQTANTNSGGTFWAGSLITFVVITFLGFLFMGVEAALMTALFLGILVGIMMLYMGLIGGWVIGMLVGAEIILIIYTVISSYKSNIG
jgi:hypothetical protein